MAKHCTSVTKTIKEMKIIYDEIRNGSLASNEGYRLISCLKEIGVMQKIKKQMETPPEPPKEKYTYEEFTAKLKDSGVWQVMLEQAREDILREQRQKKDLS